MRLVLSRRRPAVLALQPCAVRTGCDFFVRTDREDDNLNALMLPVIFSGSAEAARLANSQQEQAPPYCVVTCRPDRILVSTTDVCTPLCSPLIRCCEVSKQRSGAYPRSRSAITTARILIRKLQRYMYLSAHGVVPSGIQSICSALPLVEFWY
ncbi:hypothetical protein N431DRAFT_503429 [Stipitochalara longipes BDJ]|nr:hypothetical protein N431DRAFT_503429 [Stipitochalara longipes BDJ]